jgi:hypothetical protein
LTGAYESDLIASVGRIKSIGEKMNKTQLIEAVANGSGLTQKDTARVHPIPIAGSIGHKPPSAC